METQGKPQTPPIGNPGEAMREVTAILRHHGYAVDEVESDRTDSGEVYEESYTVTGNLLGLFDGNRLGTFSAKVQTTGIVVIEGGAFGRIVAGVDGESTDDPFDGL